MPASLVVAAIAFLVDERWHGDATTVLVLAAALPFIPLAIGYAFSPFAGAVVTWRLLRGYWRTAFWRTDQAPEERIADPIRRHERPGRGRTWLRPLLVGALVALAAHTVVDGIDAILHPATEVGAEQEELNEVGAWMTVGFGVIVSVVASIEAASLVGSWIRRRTRPNPLASAGYPSHTGGAGPTRR